ncbi:MAG TPA: polymer-forming cytoskeletal protein, partial [Thermoanaerobaculia bacterium]|nr:polymer-forming cytoskeletal protein [Thermoanaerobaculia bacterium]
FGKRASPDTKPEASRTPPGPTRVGPGVAVQGELSADEDVAFDGRLEGRVSARAEFRLGPNGRVRGPVSARVVVIGGRVEGDVVATERVEILPGGVLEGDIRAPRIVISEGARFRGSVDMGERADGPAASRDAVPTG